MEKSDIKQIGDLTLARDDFDGLVKFFDNVLQSECDYVVAIARRCFALQNIFVRYGDKTAIRIISDNALLSYADKFARQYLETGGFPTVLLVDDLLLYGRKIAHWLHDFEQLIIYEYMSMRGIEELTDGDKFYLHRDFMDAINIYVYAMNQAPTLINSIYERMVQAETKRYTNELKGLSQSISNFIQETNEPNTSYRMSLMVNTDLLDGLVEKAKFIYSCNCRYRGETRNVYLLDDYVGSKFIPFAYTHGRECFNSNGKTWITGVSVGGNISITAFNEICQATILVLNEAHNGQGKRKYSFLLKLLEHKEKEIQSQRTQLLSYILSVINVHDFCNKIGLNIAQLKNDDNLSHIDHIAYNFGLKDDVTNCFETIAFDGTLVASLKTALYPFFEKTTSKLGPDNVASMSIDSNQSEQLIGLVEEVFQKIGMKADKEAFYISTYEKCFEPQKSSKDICHLDKWLEELDEVVRNANTASVSLYSKLANLITVVDSGLAALNFEYNQESDAICCSVKAGELSTFSIPRKIHWFIPALTHIEKNYYGTGYTAKELVKKFIEHLSNYKPERGEYEEFATDLENEARQYLAQHGQGFAEWLYDTGHAFRCWDVELLTYGDWREENVKKKRLHYFIFLMRNNVRRKLYVEEAKQFMKNYK